MSRWFRVYDEILDDPKVQRLPGDDFKVWMNLLALASKHDGKLPDVEDVAFALRVSVNAVAAVLSRLADSGLLDRRQGGRYGSHYAPHGWDKRQYKSDSSAERMQRHRGRHKAISVTPPETEAETEAERKESIADAMDGKPSNAMVEAPTNPPAAIDLLAATIEPVDLKRALFTAGVPYLVRHGTAERTGRAMLGKWRQQYGDGAVLDALHLAQSEACSDPIPMITKILERRHGNSTGGTFNGNRAYPVRASYGKAARELVQQAFDDAEGEDSAESGINLGRPWTAIQTRAR